MKLSSHEEYGLRCLLQVARQGAERKYEYPGDQPQRRHLDGVCGQVDAHSAAGRVC